MASTAKLVSTLPSNGVGTACSADGSLTGFATTLPVVAKRDRYSQAERVIGSHLLNKVATSKTLVVGAGGIGCELLKNMVCTGFADITIIDLDTIDTSNLNRQFLFQKRHVKRPKSLVARETALTFNPHISISALHNNIKDPQFDVAFFSRFDLVLNALDNLDARRHVNKMCLAAGVPLIESGTAGYRGQVQPIKKGEVECYDCQPKPVAKTFPVCTIRSTPSTPIHCIVWAKSYLFPQLFGPEDENEGAELDKAVQEGESLKEIDNLRAEAKAMKAIRQRLSDPNAARAVFDKVYKQDILRLLSMEDMWKNRTKPTPLEYTDLDRTTTSDQSSAKPSSTQYSLKDQRTLSLSDNFLMFKTSLLALGARVAIDGAPLSWDKDDDDALNFATAAANLRAAVFQIDPKTRFEVKEMAGNIIPAIATTNSAVSALLVFQALQLLRGDPNFFERGSRPWYGKAPDRIIIPGTLDRPNPNCDVCQVVYVTLQASASCTLDDLMTLARDRLGSASELTVQEGTRVLYEPDFDDNGSKTFGELGLEPGKMVMITEEDQEYMPIVFIVNAPQTSNPQLPSSNLPESIPRRTKNPDHAKEEPNEGPALSGPRKRLAPDEQGEERPTKRLREGDIDNELIVIDDEPEAGVIAID